MREDEAMAEVRPEILVRREHVGDRRRARVGQLAPGVGRLDAAGDLVGPLALHAEPVAQLVVRHHGPGRDPVEADRRAQVGDIDVVAQRRRAVGRRAPTTQDQTDEAVLAFDGDPKTLRRQDLDGGWPRDIVRRGASRQGDLRPLLHHIVADWRVFLVLGHGRRACQQQAERKRNHPHVCPLSVSTRRETFGRGQRIRRALRFCRSVPC